MRISETRTFATNSAAVFALMTDRDFQEQKAARVGAQSFDMEILTGQKTIQVITTRVVATSGLPEFVKPMLRPTMRVVETEHWNLENPTAPCGKFHIDVHGAPVYLRGTVRLEPLDAGCELTFAGDIISSVPLFRTRVEEASAGSILDTIRTEFDLLQEWGQADPAKAA